MAIHFFTEEIKFKLEHKLVLKSWIKNTIHSAQLKVGNINYIFCSDEYILNINREYLKHDYFTDIITFNYNDDTNINSDIYISIDTVTRNASDYSTTFQNELHRVMIHGILHLIGYNDATDDEKLIMRNKEDHYLSLLIN